MASKHDPFKIMDLNFGESKKDNKNSNTKIKNNDIQNEKVIDEYDYFKNSNTFENKSKKNIEREKIMENNTNTKEKEISEEQKVENKEVKNNSNLTAEKNVKSSNQIKTIYDKTIEDKLKVDVKNPLDKSVNPREKSEKKKAEKKARHHRKISFWWIFILILAIAFGIDSIYNFGVNIGDFVDNIQNDDAWVGSFFKSFFASFEAILFLFFIIFSFKRFSYHNKPWKNWWKSTEPERLAVEIAKQKEIKFKYIKKTNELGLIYNQPVKEISSDRELVEFLKSENKILAEMIKIEEKSGNNSSKKDQSKDKDKKDNK